MKKLIVLGAGDAFATGGKHTTSFLVTGDANGFLIDCGASTLVRLKQEKYPLHKINQVFITHFHGDHYGGLPFLFISYAFQVSEPFSLTIYGPTGIEEQVKKLHEVMYPDTWHMIEPLPIQFVEYGRVWQSTPDLEVQAIPVVHSPPSFPHGLRFRWDKKILAFSGDTEWTENLIDIAKDAELFITECNNLNKETPGHLSYKSLTDNLSDLQARKIMISHMGEDMLKFDQSVFDKLSDGQVIELW